MPVLPLVSQQKSVATVRRGESSGKVLRRSTNSGCIVKIGGLLGASLQPGMRVQGD